MSHRRPLAAAVALAVLAAGPACRVREPPEAVRAKAQKADIEQELRSLQGFFRGNQAALLFQARITSDDLPNQFADLELAGGLQDMKLVDGILAAGVQLFHFRVQKASVGPLAGVVDGLVRDNLRAIQDAIPRFEIPPAGGESGREEPPEGPAGGDHDRHPRELHPKHREPGRDSSR